MTPFGVMPKGGWGGGWGLGVGGSGGGGWGWGVGRGGRLSVSPAVSSFGQVPWIGLTSRGEERLPKKSALKI